MKKSVSGAILLVYTSIVLGNNPFRAQFPDAPLWTDSLNWQNTVSVLDHIQPGEETADSAVARAFRALGTAGGTVFFPEGEYKFSSSIALPSGVILRGEAPVHSDARVNNFAPPSRLVFPKYIPVFEGNGTANNTAFKAITTPVTSVNCALVHLDINRGRIALGNSYSERMLIFGVRQNNVAQPDGGVPDTTFMNGWQRFSNRHTRNISVNAKRAAAIANCRVNDLLNNTIHPIEDDSYDQPGYIINGSFVAKKGADPSTAEDDPGSISSSGRTTMKYGERIKFNYLDHYGIFISGAKMNPAINPVPIDQEILLLNNWVLTTMRVSYFIEGIGAIARGNVKADKQGKTGWIHPNGKSLNSNNSATFENRGLNFAGENILIEDNNFDVQRHRFVSGYMSVDGEGILIQWQDPWGFDTNNPASGANTRIYDVTIRNNTVNAYIGIYDIPLPISNLRIEGNNLLGKGNVLVFKKERMHRIDNLYIENNINITGISVGNKIGTEYAMPGSNIYIRNNTLSSGSINFPFQAIVSGNVNAAGYSQYDVPIALPVVQLPYHGAYNVSDSAKMELQFSHPIEAVNLTGIYIQSHASEQKRFVTSQVNNNTLTINNPDGFPDDFSKYSVVVPMGALKINGTSISNDSIGWTFRSGVKNVMTDIAQPLTQQVTLYPNPATDYIKLSGTGTNQVEVQIIDMHGIIRIKKAIPDNGELNLKNLDKGVYVVRINHSVQKLILR